MGVSHWLRHGPLMVNQLKNDSYRQALQSVFIVLGIHNFVPRFEPNYSFQKSVKLNWVMKNQCARISRQMPQLNQRSKSESMNLKWSAIGSQKFVPNPKLYIPSTLNIDLILWHRRRELQKFANNAARQFQTGVSNKKINFTINFRSKIT